MTDPESFSMLAPPGEPAGSPLNIYNGLISTCGRVGRLH
jgi:hypothetical protein